MADGSRKPIEDVEVGDEVVATDPRPESRSRRASSTSSFTKTPSLYLGGLYGEVITTTEDHPFWSVTDQRFERSPTNWRPGRIGADGRVITVSGLQLGTAREALADNLSVQGIHTYHVGDDEYFVDNSCFTSLNATKNPKSLEGLAPSQIDDLARNAGFEISSR